GGGEDVGHALLVEEVDDSAVRGGSEPTEHREDLVLHDQLAGHVDGGGRVVPVVFDPVVDLAAVNASLGVDVVEHGPGPLGNRQVARCGRPGLGLVRTDDDGVVGDACGDVEGAVVADLARTGAGGGCQSQGREHRCGARDTSSAS